MLWFGFISIMDWLGFIQLKEVGISFKNFSALGYWWINSTTLNQFMIRWWYQMCPNHCWTSCGHFLKVQLTPQFFHLYKSHYFPVYHCTKMIKIIKKLLLLWICYIIFEILKISPFHGHNRAIAKNGVCWPITSSKDQQCFASKKNVCKHAIQWFKIATESKEYVFLKGFIAQHV